MRALIGQLFRSGTSRANITTLQMLSFPRRSAWQQRGPSGILYAMLPTTRRRRRRAAPAPPPCMRTTMAAGAARLVAPVALRAAKAAAHGVGSAAPGSHVAMSAAHVAMGARSSRARGRTALRLPPAGASHGSVSCAARLPARSERAAMPSPRVPRRNSPRAAAAADGAERSSPTIIVRVRLSGAAGPAGDLVLHNVDPHASTPRALVARWAAELGISAEPCTAVARADRAGADEVPLHDPGATLSAAGVADGSVVLVKLLAGAKLIMLRPSADKVPGGAPWRAWYGQRAAGLQRGGAAQGGGCVVVAASGG